MKSNFQSSAVDSTLQSHNKFLNFTCSELIACTLIDSEFNIFAEYSVSSKYPWDNIYWQFCLL